MFGNAFALFLSLLLVNKVVCSNDAGWINSDELQPQPRSFPCPDSEAIAPCFCEYLNERLYLECSNVTSETQLKDIFREEFPVKDFYSFRLTSNDYIEELNFNTNGVSFQRITLFPGPFIFDRLSINFLLSSYERLEDLILENNRLTLDRFPFEYVNTLPALHRLYLDGNNIADIPKFLSESLRDVHLTRSDVSSVPIGTFDEAQVLYDIELSYNKINRLAVGVFPVHYNTIRINVANNGLSFLGRRSFYDGSINGTVPGLTYLYLQNNELTQLDAENIPLTQRSQLINLENNRISAITSTNVFYKLSEPVSRSIQLLMGGNLLTTVEEDRWVPVMSYLSLLDLKENPLDCGCDIAWVILNASYLSKISAETRCKDGQRVIDLDADLYADLCYGK